MIILGLLVVFNSSFLGQERTIKLDIVDCTSTKASVSFCLTITNISNQSIVTYIPKKDDICYGLIKINILDLQNKKVHEFYPGTFYAADLDCITINDDNTLFLKSNEKFNQKFRLSKKDIFPHLKGRKHYKLFVEWYLEGVCFKTDLKNLFQKDVKSTGINFRN